MCACWSVHKFAFYPNLLTQTGSISELPFQATFFENEGHHHSMVLDIKASMLCWDHGSSHPHVPPPCLLQVGSTISLSQETTGKPFSPQASTSHTAHTPSSPFTLYAIHLSTASFRWRELAARPRVTTRSKHLHKLWLVETVLGTFQGIYKCLHTKSNIE